MALNLLRCTLLIFTFLIITGGERGGRLFLEMKLKIYFTPLSWQKYWIISVSIHKSHVILADYFYQRENSYLSQTTKDLAVIVHICFVTFRCFTRLSPKPMLPQRFVYQNTYRIFLLVQ